MEKLVEKARKILVDNDRGGFTIPSKHLYPYQWNWDSVFCALGFSYFDLPRAWQELDTLLKGQWKNGMLPHIIFRKDDPNYFPGPKIWGCPNEIPTSCYSQPPVLATVLKHLILQEPTNPLGKQFYEKTLKSHEWWFNERLDAKSQLIAVAHPWESGRDNSPCFDAAIKEIELEKEIPHYDRRDLKHVAASRRPRKYDYDRYLAILKYGRDNEWDAEKIKSGPFWVADVGINFILLRANRDLLFLANLFNDAVGAEKVTAWIEHMERKIIQLWNEELGVFCCKDLRTNVFSGNLSNVSFLNFFSGVTYRSELVLQKLGTLLSEVIHGIPSNEPKNENFEAERYWRGPVWLVVNFLVAKGLRESGHLELAEKIQTNSIELIKKSGFYEYFNPLNGEGLGGSDFSWTAAVYLAWRL